MQRLTLVNRFAFPDDSPTSRLMNDLARGLVAERRGVEVRVLSCNRYYSGAATALPARQTLDGVRYHRLWVPPANRRGLLTRAFGYLAFYLQGLLVLLAGLRRGDLVICMTDPPMFGVLATLAARLHGAKVVHWVQDLYPDVVQSAGLTRSVPLMSLLSALRRSAYRASNKLVVIGEGMRDRLLRDGSGCPIAIIPNWADGSSIHPVAREHTPLYREWLPDRSFVVGYFGNLGFAHNYHSSLQAAARLQPRSEVQFLWVGDGSRRIAFQQEVAQLALGNVHWHNQQPFERISETLAVADIHLVTLDPQFDEVLVPSKTYSALAAGRPLLFLGNPNSELARLVREYQVGVVVAQEDVEGLVAVIQQLADQPDLCRQMGMNARQLFDQRFERRRAVALWLALIDELLP